MINQSITILLVAFAGAGFLQTIWTGGPEAAAATTPAPTKKPYVWQNESYITPAVNEKLAAANLQAASRFGLPSYDNLRLFNSFLLSYDRRLKGPAWVMEHLTKRNYENNADRSLSFFKADETLHELFRSRNDDYSRRDRRRPGYDRGHQAPAGDFLFDQDSMGQSFCMSNVMPQTAQLNRGAWVRLEKYIKFLSSHESTKNVYVVTGPLFLPERDQEDGELYVRYKVIGPDRISVPPHFFKVFLRETQSGELILDAFVMPNSYDERLRTLDSIEEFRWPLDKLSHIEQATGSIFFDKLDRKSVRQPQSGFELDFEDKPIIFNN